MGEYLRQEFPGVDVYSGYVDKDFHETISPLKWAEDDGAAMMNHLIAKYKLGEELERIGMTGGFEVPVNYTESYWEEAMKRGFMTQFQNTGDWTGDDLRV